MRMRVAGVVCLLLGFAGCGADPGDAAEEEAATPVVESTAAATATPVNCPPVTSTLDEHVTAKRATVRTTTFFIFTFKTYYSTGPLKEQLGTNGADVVTLYKVSGGYSSMLSDCPLCGNGVRDTSTGEECDGTDLGGATCASVDPTLHGALACDSWSCTFDTRNCGKAACGNGQLDPGEDCDGTLFNIGPSCTINPDAVGGSFRCTGSCTLDASGCIMRCGNGVIDPGEECDGAARAPAFAGKSCKDIANPRHTWPFNTVVNWGAGDLLCNACRVTFDECSYAPGCYQPLGGRLGLFPNCF
jgi:hypothetical protein